MAISFESYQKWFREYDEQRGLQADAPLESLGHLMEEVGEIARHILRLEGHKVGAHGRASLPDATERAEEIAELALELSDAFVFLTKLANAYGIEWDETIRQAIEKAEVRWDVEAGRQEAARRRKAHAGGGTE
ncbi:MAG: MazG nucleotide pyrophosphohydrolase domain-containing protein [Ardenticatenaceae bacterium]